MNTDTRILFTDLDGTLLNDDKEITAGNREAMQEALSRGHKIVVCTGRALPSGLMIAEKAGLTGEGCYVIAFNGAQIYEPARNRTIFSKPLPKAVAKPIFEEGIKRGFHMQSYSRDYVMVLKETPELARYIADTKKPYMVAPDVDAVLPIDPYKLSCISYDNRAGQDKFREEVLAPLAGTVDCFHSNDAYLEIVSAGVSKGSAVRWLCDYLDIPIENSVAAGDAPNDVEMLKAAHIGAVMCNCYPGVREYGDYITEHDNNHDGWAEIVKKFILC